MSTQTDAIYSQEVPDLLQQHLDQLLASGISIEVIRERGYKTATGSAELDKLGFAPYQQRTPGILMPQYAADGIPIEPQYKPDVPRKNTKTGRANKYENVPHKRMRLDVPPRCAKNAGNPNVECWITEGIKKADSLVTHGAQFVINVRGVWNFKGKNEFDSPTFQADFDLIGWHSKDGEGHISPRRVFITYDSDIIAWLQVNKATQRLKAHLERKGAAVYIVSLPDGVGGKKQGVDDFLVAGHSLDDLRKLASQDVPEVKPPPLSGENTFGGWRYGADGLFNRDSTGAETLRLKIPIRPLRILCTPEKRQVLSLELTISGRPRNVYLDDSWVGKRSSDATKDLADYGVPVTTRDAYTLQQFVAEVLRGTAFPQERAYRTLGWHGDTLCVPSLDGSIFIPPIGFDWLEGYQVSKCDEMSAVEAWQHMNELARESPVIYVAIGAGLAAPFLKDLPRTQYISSTIHIHSPSTGTGKTTLEDIAAATNGDPRSLVRTWDGTKVGMEVTFGTVRNMTVFLNELGDAKFGTPCDVVMMLPEEKGRSRGTASGALRPTFEWRTLVLSTGNAPIAQGSAHHARRVLSIPVALCGEDFAYEGQRVSQKYYGWPLRWCSPLYKTTRIAEGLDDITICYEKLYTGELSPLKPQARTWALVEMGARMLLAVLGMDEGEAHTGMLKIAKLSALRRQAEGVDYVQRLIDIVKEAVARDPAGFGASFGEERPRQGNKGRVFTSDDGDEGNEWKEVAILPGVLHELVRWATLPDVTGILIEARERKILKTDKDKSRLTKLVRVGSSPVRCYVFDLSVTTKDEDGGNDSERAVTTCYHQPTFVTTVTTKNNSPFIYIKKENIGGNGGNSGNKEINTIKKATNPVTTTVTTSGNKSISPTDDNLSTSKGNGSVEL